MTKSLLLLSALLSSSVTLPSFALSTKRSSSDLNQAKPKNSHPSELHDAIQRDAMIDPNRWRFLFRDKTKKDGRKWVQIDAYIHSSLGKSDQAIRLYALIIKLFWLLISWIPLGSDFFASMHSRVQVKHNDTEA